MTAPLLVFGWGNASRGDDALGPLFVQQLGSLAGASAGVQVDFLEDYQLQIEHALDLACRERVLFVDASISCTPPFEVTTATCGARREFHHPLAFCPVCDAGLSRPVWQGTPSVHAASDPRDGV
jgi:hypothetical protein